MDTIEDLWDFCIGKLSLEKIDLLRSTEWFDGAEHPNITDFEDEISTMNEYLKQTMGSLRLEDH